MIHPIETAIPLPYAEIAAFCERNHIRQLWVFGSVLRNDFRSDSDIDVLVEFDPAHIPGWEIVSMEDELACLLGRSVDLGTPNSLRESASGHILSTAQLIYERA